MIYGGKSKAEVARSDRESMTVLDLLNFQEALVGRAVRYGPQSLLVVLMNMTIMTTMTIHSGGAPHGN